MNTEKDGQERKRLQILNSNNSLTLIHYKIEFVYLTFLQSLTPIWYLSTFTQMIIYPNIWTLTKPNIVILPLSLLSM